MYLKGMLFYWRYHWTILLTLGKEKGYNPNHMPLTWLELRIDESRHC